MLDGSLAFQAISNLMSGKTIEDIEFKNPAFQRLRQAVDDCQSSEKDLALLTRQVLRYEALRRQEPVSIKTQLFRKQVAEIVGLEANNEKNMLQVTALPWCPEWLDDCNLEPPDDCAMRASRVRFFSEDNVEGDKFLTTLGWSHYRSAGQKLAVRSALSMPVRSMLMIDLPTGEGKSLVFQAIEKIGFADEGGASGQQVTIVVVPTIALALDHERSCGGSREQPMAYVGGDSDRNQTLIDALNSGTQSLIFIAPEAMIGPLFATLTKVVTKNGLRAVVVDEAHLIEGWGTGFRSSFQIMSGVLNLWRNLASAPEFRVVFLSATLSSSARATINELFGVGQEIPTVIASKMRPEPHYWVADPVDEETRKARVIEALHHLPRPAILYVTRVDDAKRWFAILTQTEGYQRIDLLHGGTSSHDRERILQDWSEGSLDVVVATSAFGLGVDYQHVRTIIHACIPEKMDRFYQEVGRGGRDGCNSISLMIPAENDFSTAKGLAREKLISVERGLQRWRAMFSGTHTREIGPLEFAVRLDTAPGMGDEDIDMVGSRSVDWNSRILSMMSRCGLVELTAIPLEHRKEIATPHLYQGVRLTSDKHMSLDTWRDKFQKLRETIARENEKSQQLLERYIKKQDCPASLIREIYPLCAHQCSSCHLCRRDGCKKQPEGIMGIAPLPWPFQTQLSEKIINIVGRHKKIVVEYAPSLQSPLRRRDIETLFMGLHKNGFRTVVNVGRPPDWVSYAQDKTLRSLPWCTIADDAWNSFVWPKGPKIIFVGGNVSVAAAKVTQEPKAPEIIFLEHGQADASHSERLLTEVVNIPVFGLRDFLRLFAI